MSSLFFFMKTGYNIGSNIEWNIIVMKNQTSILEKYDGIFCSENQRGNHQNLRRKVEWVWEPRKSWNLDAPGKFDQIQETIKKAQDLGFHKPLDQKPTRFVTPDGIEFSLGQDIVLVNYVDNAILAIETNWGNNRIPGKSTKVTFYLYVYKDDPEEL